MGRIYNLKINRLPESELDFLCIDKCHKNVVQHNKSLNITNVKKILKLPIIVDWRNKMPPIYDQGSLGSCTAQAFCGLIGYDKPRIIGSRLFLYYNERRMDNNIPNDSGAYLSDGVKCLTQFGICQESIWPYIIDKFAVCPLPRCYNQALKHKALQVKNIRNTLLDMKSSLANGYPFVVGILIYSSFESNATGVIPMPNVRTERHLGGHAVVCVGYDDNKQVWIMRNSWGTGWGMAGYFTLPYQYLLDSNLSSDLWNIMKIA
jgi:C1A family cysteine protease